MAAASLQAHSAAERSGRTPRPWSGNPKRPGRPSDRRASGATGLGGGDLNPDLPVPKTGVLPLHHPRSAALRVADTTMPPMPAPTVVILAAGEGTRMRSALPKVLHPICGRPMILWPLLAARAAGAERVVVVDNPKRRLAEHLPDDVEVAIQERAARDRGRRRRRRGRDRSDRARPDHQRRHAADHRRGDRRARRGARRRRAPPRRSRAWSSRTRPATAASSAAPTAASSASSRRRPRATRPSRSSRSARSTPACTCSTAARCSPRSPTSTPTTRRASSTCPACCRSCATAGKLVQAYPLADPDLALGVNDRVDLAHVTRLAQRRIHAATSAPASRSSTPRAR